MTVRRALNVYHLSPQVKEALPTYSNSILITPPVMHIKARRSGITAQVTGIYVKDDVLYYQLQVDNPTTLDYDIELLRFFTADRKKAGGQLRRKMI